MRRSITVLAVTCLIPVACGPASDVGSESQGDTPPAEPEGVYGQAVPAMNGLRSVVLLRSESPVLETAFPTPRIDQFGLVFSPQRLIVRAGQPMEFTNSEASLSHNVQVWPLGSSSPILDSDALPEDAISFTPEAGPYDILCDEHPGMRSFIFATDAPLAVFAEEDGSFDFGVLPSGDYVIQGWAVETGFGSEIPISVGDGATGVDVRPSVEGSEG